MQEVDIDQAAAAAERNATVLDVREPDEYAEGHIPGAVNIPMGQLTRRLSEIDRDRPVLLVCASGNRSGVMTEVLRAAGFEASNVAGGTSAWSRSGRPTEK